MTIIHVDSELMKNQKAAQLMAAQSQMTALQVVDGGALLLSISDTGSVVAVAERPGQSTGSVVVDLTSELSARHGGRAVTAKVFTAQRDPASGAISIATSVAVAGETAPRVYVMTGLPDAPDAAWLTQAGYRPWVERPYDDTTNPRPVFDIQYLRLGGVGSGRQGLLLLAGVVTPPGGVVRNYTIDPDPTVTTKVWRRFQTAEDYQQMIGMCLGRPSVSIDPGLYQLYSQGDDLSLTFRPGTPGSPVLKLAPPDRATSLTACVDTPQTGTDLYVAAAGTVYLYPSADQRQGAKGIPILSDPQLADVPDLFAYRTPDQVVLWGRTVTGVVFYATCPVGRQAESSAWSPPVSLLTGVQQVASYTASTSGAHVLFAHTAGQALTKLTQDPVTTTWRSSSVMLPAPDPGDMVEVHTFTTHVAVTDGANMPLPYEEVTLTALASCGVFVSGLYLRLEPEGAVPVRTDETGALVIVQETEALGAVTYRITHPQAEPVTVNPMLPAVARLGTVDGVDSLRNITVVDELGDRSRLVPADADPHWLEAVAKSLPQLAEVAAQVPQDGSVQPPDPRRRGDVVPAWGISFRPDGPVYWELDASAGTALAALPVRLPVPADGDIWSAIELLAGDALRWMKSEAARVKDVSYAVRDGITHCFVTIGETLYRFALRAMAVVVQVAEFLIAQLKVLFADLARWIGFVFPWHDIVRTHRALRNIIRRYLEDVLGDLDGYRQKVGDAFADVDNRIAEWAKLKAIEGSVASTTPSLRPPAGQHRATSNWLVHQMRGNLAQASTTSQFTPQPTSEMEQLASDLLTAVQQEEGVLTDAYHTVAEQILPELTALSAGELTERMLGVLGQVLVGSVENVLDLGIKLMEDLVDGAMVAVDAPVEVPVIAQLYRRFVGDTFTVLDLCCLAAAVPVTVTYRLTDNTVPFPDDEFTDAVINAPDLATIRRLYAAPGRTRGLGAPPAASLEKILHVSAYFGSTIFACTTTLKALGPGVKPISIANGVLFMVATAPAIAQSITSADDQSWDMVLAEVLYATTVAQKIAEMFTYLKQDERSPLQSVATIWAEATKWVDLILGVASCVPAMAAFARRHDTRGILSYLAAISWNENRILTPAADAKEEPPVAFILKLMCIEIYGGLHAYLGYSLQVGHLSAPGRPGGPWRGGPRRRGGHTRCD